MSTDRNGAKTNIELDEEVETRDAEAEIEALDHLDDDGLAGLRRQLARWADDNGATLMAAAPEIPPGFHNRVRANWKLLLAIAESVGGDWKRRAWRVASTIEKVRETFEQSIGLQLLSDIRTMFAASGADFMTSLQIVAKLTADPEKPWAE
jgi:hypothetical protein